MIRPVRLHLDRPEGKIIIRKLFDLNVARQLGKRHGKVGAFHLPRQRGHQTRARAFAAQNAQMTARFINRRKKGQPLDVIPVRVRQQQREVEGAVLEFLQQRPAQLPQARAGVQNDDLPAVTHLHTRGVSAVTNRARPGGGDGTAHTPEFYAHAEFDKPI